MGNGKLSDQHICHQVSAYASVVKTAQEASIADFHKSKLADIDCKKVNIYAEKSEEVLFLSDGVCVGEQKPTRDKVPKEGKERTNINIMMLQIPSQTNEPVFETIVAAEGIDETALAKSLVRKHYKDVSKIPIVCISDGATCLKNQNKAIFGDHVVHILDWYHLQAKITQLMSQIAPNKEIKETMIKFLVDNLWNGKTNIALLGLNMLKPKNKLKHQELKGYLEKNKPYIIDYDYRKSIGKTIGSGRMEKQIDMIVAKRQKRKGMAWSAKGARSLAILTAYHKKYA